MIAQSVIYLSHDSSTVHSIVIGIHTCVLYVYVYCVWMCVFICIIYINMCVVYVYISLRKKRRREICIYRGERESKRRKERSRRPTDNF